MALDYEQQFYSDKIQYIVGTDEAGRGCLLGPVFAGAVILPKDFLLSNKPSTSPIPVSCHRAAPR